MDKLFDFQNPFVENELPPTRKSNFKKPEQSDSKNTGKQDSSKEYFP